MKGVYISEEKTVHKSKETNSSEKPTTDMAVTEASLTHSDTLEPCCPQHSVILAALSDNRNNQKRVETGHRFKQNGHCFSQLRHLCQFAPEVKNSRGTPRVFCQEKNMSPLVVQKGSQLLFFFGSLWEGQSQWEGTAQGVDGSLSSQLYVGGMQMLHNPILSTHVTRLLNAKYFLNRIIVKALPTHCCPLLSTWRLPRLPSSGDEELQTHSCGAEVAPARD